MPSSIKKKEKLLGSNRQSMMQESKFHDLFKILSNNLASLVAQLVKSVCLQCGRPGFDPWVEKIPGEGNGNPLQYSCLENPMDRGA